MRFLRFFNPLFWWGSFVTETVIAKSSVTVTREHTVSVAVSRSTNATVQVIRGD